ncbi:MAG TPA: hypothetical protein VNU93_05530 [Verrucomicrobiae bacterium]|nr:hypothetical protein [Verrucomicrobiae bacterium]
MLPKVIQWALVAGFMICLGLYLYFMYQRVRKKADVDMKLWVVVATGLLLSILAQLFGLSQGVYKWQDVKFSTITSAALIVIAILIMYRKKFPKAKPPVKDNPKKGKGSGKKNGNKGKK